MIITFIVVLITIGIIIFTIYASIHWPKESKSALAYLHDLSKCVTWPIIVFMISIVFGPMLLTKIYKSDHLELQLFNNNLVIGNALEDVSKIKKGLREIVGEPSPIPSPAIINDVGSTPTVTEIKKEDVPILETLDKLEEIEENLEQQIQQQIQQHNLK